MPAKDPDVVPRVVNTFHDHPSVLLRAAHAAGLIQHVTPPTGSMASVEVAAWLKDQLPGASAAMIGPLNVQRFGKDELEIAGPSLRVVTTFSVGFDHIDVPECTKRGVKVANTPNISDDAVANHTLLLLLMVMRRALEHVELVRGGGWPGYHFAIASHPLHLTGQNLAGRTVGFFGFGRIAQKVAERLLALGPRRILYSTSTARPFTANAFPRLHRVTSAIYESVEVNNEHNLLRLAEESDVLICLCALTPTTFHAINKDVLSRMKKHAIVVNMARGPVVDTAALVDALQTGQILGAALDVVEGEPNVAVDHPLLHESLRHRVVVTPHCASAETPVRMEMAELTARCILSALDIPVEAWTKLTDSGATDTSYL